MLAVHELASATDEQLLALRLCDLPLKIAGTPLEQRVANLYRQLSARGLRFQPHVWLSEEWFTPDEVPGFAIPFYLAHPRLIKLERRQMLEVEGGTQVECLRIMRHEAGHAIDNAFHLHARRRYRALFGSFTRPYPNWYKPEPHSRDYVLHLPAWYAQAHPAEDFAETFAVWLTLPAARWRKQYADWRALRKLEFVDEVMREVANKPPTNKSRAQPEALPTINTTLREHYQKKREYYAFQWPPDYDRDLLRIFSEPRAKAATTAVSFLRRHQRELCREVAEGTGVHSYAIDQLFKAMINRCRELKLRVSLTPERAREKVLVLLTAQTMNGIHTGYHRIAL